MLIKITIYLVFMLSFSIVEAVTLDDDKRLAGHPSTSAEKLWDLSKSKNWQVRESLGYNRRTPIELLKKLASDNDAHVRIAVATNLSTTEAIFEILATDKDVAVRSVVARFEYVPDRILAILANDQVVDIRIEVARNLNTTKATLQKLLKDSHAEVSQIASQRMAENE